MVSTHINDTHPMAISKRCVYMPVAAFCPFPDVKNLPVIRGPTRKVGQTREIALRSALAELNSILGGRIAAGLHAGEGAEFAYETVGDTQASFSWTGTIHKQLAALRVTRAILKQSTAAYLTRAKLPSRFWRGPRKQMARLSSAKAPGVSLPTVAPSRWHRVLIMSPIAFNVSISKLRSYAHTPLTFKGAALIEGDGGGRTIYAASGPRPRPEVVTEENSAIEREPLDEVVWVNNNKTGLVRVPHYH